MIKKTYKYYAGGVEISKKEHEKIFKGETDKHLIYASTAKGVATGVPLLSATDHINVIGKQLDHNDPPLKSIMKELGASVKQLYIIHIFYGKHYDILTTAIKAMVFGYADRRGEK